MLKVFALVLFVPLCHSTTIKKDLSEADSQSRNVRQMQDSFDFADLAVRSAKLPDNFEGTNMKDPYFPFGYEHLLLKQFREEAIARSRRPNTTPAPAYPSTPSTQAYPSTPSTQVYPSTPSTQAYPSSTTTQKPSTTTVHYPAETPSSPAYPSTTPRPQTTSPAYPVIESHVYPPSNQAGQAMQIQTVCRALRRDGYCTTSFGTCIRSGGMLAPDFTRCLWNESCCLPNVFALPFLQK